MKTRLGTLWLTIVTTAHQNESGIDLNSELSLPASAKYTADEKSTTPGGDFKFHVS
jgi:hypothetical protein